MREEPRYEPRHSRPSGSGLFTSREDDRDRDRDRDREYGREREPERDRRRAGGDDLDVPDFMR